MKRRLYFNLDLTLTEMDESFDECLIETLREFGVSEEIINAELYSELFFNYFEGFKDSPREKALVEYSDRKSLDIDCKEASEEYSKSELKAVRPVKDLKELLGILSESFQLGIITAGTTELQKEKLQKLGIEDNMEEILITYEEEKSKKEILKEVKKKTEIKPIYFSNSESDIEKAEEAGLKTAYMNFEDLEDKPAEQIEEAIE